MKSTVEDEYLYSLEDGGAVIRKYLGAGGCVRVPPCLEGRPVVSLAETAFRHKSRIEELYLPESLQSIGSSCFERCLGIRRIVFPQSLSRIGSSAFRNCSALAHMEFPTHLDFLGMGAFSGCSKLREADIPEGLQSISAWTFANCSNLARVDIPASTAHLEAQAFFGCKHLQEANLPKGLQSIGKKCFAHCADLAQIHLPESLHEVGEGAFEGCQSMQFPQLPANVREFRAFLGSPPLQQPVYAPGIPFDAVNGQAYRICLAAGLLLHCALDPEAQPSQGELDFIRENIVSVCLQLSFREDAIAYLAKLGLLDASNFEELIDAAFSANLSKGIASLMQQRDFIMQEAQGFSLIL